MNCALQIAELSSRQRVAASSDDSEDDDDEDAPPPLPPPRHESLMAAAAFDGDLNQASKWRLVRPSGKSISSRRRLVDTLCPDHSFISVW